MAVEITKDFVWQAIPPRRVKATRAPLALFWPLRAVRLTVVRPCLPPRELCAPVRAS